MSYDAAMMYECLHDAYCKQIKIAKRLKKKVKKLKRKIKQCRT